MAELWQTFDELWSLTLGYFVDSSKRVYWLYLLTSLLLAYYVFYKSRKQGSFLSYIFNKRVWLSQSARVDYLLFLFNGFVKLFLILPYIYLGFELTFFFNERLIEHFGYMEQGLSVELGIMLYTIVLTLVTDFAVYLTHLAMHRVPCLWEFHKIHHSARSMNPLTQYRLHPVELLLNNFVAMLVFGLVTGVFNYWLMGQVNKWLFLGVNVFSLLFFMFGANLRHSHVALRYFNGLEHIFISPRQHQIHHSQAREHWNKNMGSRLALWDWLFGTLYLSKDCKRLSFGLGEGQDAEYQSFRDNLLKPFTKSIQRLLKLFKKA